MCRLHLEGFGDRPGLSKAQLGCTGGSINAAAQPQLLKLLGSAAQGVVLSNDRKCQQWLEGSACVFVVCGGTAATFVNPTVTGIKAATKEGSSAVCISGGSRVSLVNGTFSRGLDMRPVQVTGNGTTVLIRQSRFNGNNVAPSGMFGGALVVTDTAKVTIHSSSFLANKAFDGGAVAAGERAQVNLTSDKAAGSGKRLTSDKAPPM